jgi:hypothetical protein
MPTTTEINNQHLKAIEESTREMPSSNLPPKELYFKFYKDHGTELLPHLTPFFKGCSAAYARIILKDDDGREVQLSTGTIVKLPRAKLKRVFVAGLEFYGASPYQYEDPIVSLSLLLVEMESWKTFKKGIVA